MFQADDGPARVTTSATSFGALPRFAPATTAQPDVTVLLLDSGGAVRVPSDAELTDAVFLGDIPGAQCYGSAGAGVDWWKHEATIDVRDDGLHYQLADLDAAGLAAAVSCGPLPRGPRSRLP